MSIPVLILNYGMGNLHSVVRKLHRLGVAAVVSASPTDIEQADKIILPGVGHFAHAMTNLHTSGLLQPLHEAVLGRKVPILGICLGMQLMANHSEEGGVSGLGWFDAEVVKFRVQNPLAFKIPHTGWNQIAIVKNSPLMRHIPDLSEFYFVHSFHFQCKQATDVLNFTEYEANFVSAIAKENIFGVQYHPEKSHTLGEQVFKNFIDL